MNDGWRPPTTPTRATVIGELTVRRYTDDDAAALHEAVVSSIEHLRPWMPWIAHEPMGIEERLTLIRTWNVQWDDRTDFVMGIFDEMTLVGSTGLHSRRESGVLEIGYWVRATRAGHGIASRAAEQLSAIALAMDDVDIVEIHHDVANVASHRVAEKAGFTLVEEYESRIAAPAETGRSLRWRRSG